MTLSDRTVVRSVQQHTSPGDTLTDPSISGNEYPARGVFAGEPTAADGLVRETVSVQTPRTGFGAGVRVLFGLVWVADVYFKWQPSFLHRLPDVLSAGVRGQPAWLKPWFALVQGVVGVHPTVWAYMIALLETGLALALILGVARKVTYVGGAMYSFMIWSTAEGFGRSSGVATDIGAAVIYVLVFLALLALDARGRGTRPYSLDAVIERRLPWWRRVAEVRR